MTVYSFLIKFGAQLVTKSSFLSSLSLLSLFLSLSLSVCVCLCLSLCVSEDPYGDPLLLSPLRKTLRFLRRRRRQREKATDKSERKQSKAEKKKEREYKKRSKSLDGVSYVLNLHWVGKKTLPSLTARTHSLRN